MHKDSKTFDKIMKFAQEHPWRPVWPEDMKRRFLTNLVSSDDLILEVTDNDRLVAVGVLIDEIQNPGNQACLEVLGVEADGNEISRIEKLVHLAADRIPESKHGFQVTLHHSLLVSDEWFTRNRLEPYYETFEMVHKSPMEAAKISASGIEAVNDADLPELYSVLQESFKDSPDVSIPPFEQWKINRQANPSAFTWVLKDQGRITGFITLRRNLGCGEIPTLGVLPAERKRGTGRLLLSYALNKLAVMGLSTCELTVATSNEKALGLYRSLGFQVVDHYRVFSRLRVLRIT
jgi:ribosomal protein S18 acetylase RimI-like enzyme